MALEGVRVPFAPPPAAPGRPQTSASSHGRRERLETLRQREDLKDELVMKYRDRYRIPRDPEEVSLASSTIRHEVEQAVGSHAGPTEANLARLERRLQRRAEALGDESGAASVSAYSMGSGASASSRPSSLSARAPRSGGLPTGSLSARAAVGDAAYKVPLPSQVSGAVPAGSNAAVGGREAALEWSVLDKLAAQLQKQDADKQMKTQRELQQKLKADLDKQMADTQLKQEREKEQDRKLHALQVQANHEFQKQARATEAARQEQRKTEKREQLDQVEQVRAQREEERRRERKEAEELAKDIRRGLDLERQEAERRQEIRKGQVKEALVVGSESSKRRAEAQRRQKEEEEASVQDYLRLQAMRDTAKKQSQQKEVAQRDFRESLAADKAAERKREIEVCANKADEERNAKTLRDTEREKADKDRLMQLRQQTQAFQMQQIKEKKNKKEALAEEQRRFRHGADQQARTAEELERQLAEARKDFQTQHRVELERQIAAKAVKSPRRDVMSESELKLNRPLLERACQALTADQLVAMPVV